MPKFNLLKEDLIRYKRDDGKVVRASLPQIFAALMADDIAAFPALRPHQRHAWHAFLVQLGAIAIHRDGRDEPRTDADEWERIIRELTTDDFPGNEPWCLVVEDITQPAFMQPRASSAEKLDEYMYEFSKGKKTNKKKPTVNTPDELDVLVTSKNHDLKSEMGAQGEIDDWLFALVTLQTMDGYKGSGNHGISRMPSGYGNRSAFSITPSNRLGVHFCRDVQSLMTHRGDMLHDYDDFLTDDGIALVWLEIWDGAKREAITSGLDPFYIEICRRVRLCWSSVRLYALATTSEKSGGKRIFDVKGLTGDPWMPVANNPNQRGTPPAFLGPRKFGYERVVDGLTSPDWKPPYLLHPMQSERGKEMQLVARGMIRGEGGTAGYHERIVPLKPKVMRVFGHADSIKELGDIAQERIEQIRTVQRILRHAVSVFAAGGKSSIADEHRSLANPWANKLSDVVDANFFDNLQAEFEKDATDDRKDVRKKWLLGVVDDARILLSEAEDALPCPSIQRYKTRVRADSVFEGRIRGNDGLPFLFEREEEEEVWKNNDQSTQARNQTEAQMTLFK